MREELWVASLEPAVGVSTTAGTRQRRAMTIRRPGTQPSSVGGSTKGTTAVRPGIATALRRSPMRRLP